MDRLKQKRWRGRERLLAERVIVDLDGFDDGFIRRVCNIFQTDYYKDGASSDTLQGVIAFCVSEIVSLYTVNPTTMFGTINIGPDYQSLYRDFPMFEDIARDEDLDEFSIAYKAFAANVFYVLSRKLRHLQDEAIELGFSDISCSVNRFKPGLLILNIRAIQEFPNQG